jgi:hypothetical protein
MKKTILLLLIIFLAVSSCYYDSEEAIFPNINNTCDTTNITYNVTIRTMLNNYCIACHSGGGTTVLVTYDNVSAKSDRIIGSIEHKSGFLPMPQGGLMLDSCLINQFVKWVAKGKLNN